MEIKNHFTKEKIIELNNLKNNISSEFRTLSSNNSASVSKESKIKHEKIV